MSGFLQFFHLAILFLGTEIYKLKIRIQTFADNKSQRKFIRKQFFVIHTNIILPCIKEKTKYSH